MSSSSNSCQSEKVKPESRYQLEDQLLSSSSSSELQMLHPLAPYEVQALRFDGFSSDGSSSSDGGGSTISEPSSTSFAEEINSMPLSGEDQTQVREIAEKIRNLGHTTLDAYSRQNMAELGVKFPYTTISPTRPIFKGEIGNSQRLVVGPHHLFFHLKDRKGQGVEKVASMVVVISDQGEVSRGVMLKVNPQYKPRPISFWENKPIFNIQAASTFNFFNAQLEHEARKIQQFHSPYVIAPPIYVAEHNYPHQVFGQTIVYMKEYGDNLRTRLDKAPASNTQRLQWALNITDGLLEIYGRGYLHRDLKLANVLLDGEIAVMADFGNCAEIGATPEQNDPLYQAPEHLLYGVQGPEAEVWQVGQMLYELFHPQHKRPIWYRGPLMGKYDSQLGLGFQDFLTKRMEDLRQIGRMGNQQFKSGLFFGWPVTDAKTQEIQELIQSCLNLVPEYRPNLQEVRKRLAAL